MEQIDPAASTDLEALEWLEQNGCAQPDLSTLHALVRRVRAQALVGWADARAARGQRTEAIAALQRAVALDADQLGARLRLAGLLLESGRAGLIAVGAEDWPLASECFHRIQALADRPINAPLWLARVAWAQDDAAEAEKWFLAAVDWPGEADVAWEGVGRMRLRLQRPADAAQAFLGAIAEQPSTARFHTALAQAYEELGAVDQAIDSLWRALRFEPGNAEAERRLAALSRAARA
jgi:tetratricopeptide (TPR) repeat protein